MVYYPTHPRRRTSQIVRDLLFVLAACLLVWVGRFTHDTVMALAEVGRQLERTGSAVEDGFDDAARAARRAPVVGDDLARSLRRSGDRTGGRATRAGREAQERVERAAVVTGLLAGGLPLALLCLLYLPGRIRTATTLTAARRSLDAASTHEELLLVATRAAMTLPFTTLVRYTKDPFGDLAAGRLDPLVQALYDDAGLRPPRDLRQHAREQA